MPIQVKKYNSAGVLQWTYTTPYDTSSWIGTLRTDPSGTSYVTCGSTAAIQRINTSGGLVWSANGGGLDEYWGLTFNCDIRSFL